MPRSGGSSARIVALATAASGLWVSLVGAQDDQARHRAPAAYMSFLGAEWLERPERHDEELPERVLDILGIQPGDVVADVGCGSGYYARRMAARVQPGGTVYCEDIQFEMLEIMKSRAVAEGVVGITPVLGTATDPMLPQGEIDLVIIADVYHEMSDPKAMLAGIRRALAPQGRVALLEYRVEDGSGDWIKADHRMSVRQVLSEWQAAGFELDALHDFLPGQHLFVLRSTVGSGAAPALADHDLFEAMSEGLVEAVAGGAGRDTVWVRIRRTGPDQIVITSPVGTYFRDAGGHSDMIARRDGWVVLSDDDWHQWSIRAVTRRPDRPAPGAERELDILSARTAAQLEELLYQMQAGTYAVADSGTLYPPMTLAVEQAAVWIADADLSYGAIADGIPVERMSTPYAVAFALVFVDRAGIDVTARRVWSDREIVFGALRDPHLVAWYRTMSNARGPAPR